MDIKPIKNNKDYETALKEIENLMEFEPQEGTLKFDKLDLLTTIVEKYEEEHFPINSPDPIEAIKFRMDQMGLSTSDLGNYVGSRGRASEILNKKRRLTISMIRSLAKNLNIPADSLIKEYKLNLRKESKDNKKELISR